jgi:hypothetical protein
VRGSVLTETISSKKGGLEPVKLKLPLTNSI